MKNFRYIDNVAVIHLDHEKCIGCGLCLNTCPHRVFSLSEAGKAEISDYNGCMECGACATNCPVDAITVNPDEGCGCATLIINKWIHTVTGQRWKGSCC